MREATFIEPVEPDSDETLEPFYNDGGEFGEWNDSDEDDADPATENCSPECLSPSDSRFLADRAQGRWELGLDRQAACRERRTLAEELGMSYEDYMQHLEELN